MKDCMKDNPGSAQQYYLKFKRRKFLLLIFLLLILCIGVLISVRLGAVRIPYKDMFTPPNSNIIRLRMMRIILGIFVGAALSVAGCIFQAILRNPLAEPYVLGVSSGAGLGAVLSMTLGLTGLFKGFDFLPVFAFAGGLLTIILVYSLAKSDGKLPVQTLLLSGVIVAAVFSSILMFVISVFPMRIVHTPIWWLLGSMQIYDMRLLITACSFIFIGVVASIFFTNELNAISLGEEEAIHIGISVETTKKILFVLSSLITAACVSASGLIGFVGLIVPHTMRLIVGPNHKILLPASCLGGAIFLVMSDSLARTILAPSELPIGVITAIAGGPFFLILLKKRKGILFR